MIFRGGRVIKKTIGTGVFFCPREGRDRDYAQKKARRWFTLFLIPLIPLNEVGDFVECASCKNTYYPDVLLGKTASEIEDVGTIAIRHIVVSMLLADGVVDPREREAGVTVVGRFASHPYGPTDLDADVTNLQVSALADNLEDLGAVLNEHGKENVLTAAVYLAGADGHVDRAEIEVARQIGRALTMSSARIEATIQQELSRLGLHL
jgi:tellurite resistance protein